ncbi:MAG TPA: hypothetical protein VK066_23840 [Chloroflexota bacterium]|nr:hypothetical protein [Chloroflexota bacterium]
MLAPTRPLTEYLFPLVLGVFLTLYVMGLVAGTEPEMALVRATGGAVLLAVLGRVARGIVEAAPPPAPAAARPDARGQRLDVAIDDDTSAADEGIGE